MKYFTRLQVYKASNVSFNPQAIEAKSYDWWVFVKRINGQVVFNNHSYSSSTSRHQMKVRSLLYKLGIKIDLEVNTVKSLSDTTEAMKDAVTVLDHNLTDLTEAIMNPRSRKATNVKRLEQVNKLTDDRAKLIMFLSQQ